MNQSTQLICQYDNPDWAFCALVMIRLIFKSLKNVYEFKSVYVKYKHSISSPRKKSGGVSLMCALAALHSCSEHSTLFFYDLNASHNCVPWTISDVQISLVKKKYTESWTDQ